MTESSATPIAGAVVSLIPTGQRIETSASGRFELVGLSPGTHVVAIRKLGYLPVTFDVDVRRGERAMLRITLHRIEPQQLGTVIVEADRIAQRLPRVARRRATGNGRVVTGAELREIAEYMPNVRDAINWHPSLQREKARAAGVCDVYVDGLKVRKYDEGEDEEGAPRPRWNPRESQQLLEFWVSLDEIEAVEVHRDRHFISNALFDYEFGSIEKRDQCVVLIWTKYIHLRPGRQDAGYKEDPAAKELRERTALLLAEQRTRERADTAARPTGTLTGFVIDAAQRPLAGVAVTVSGSEGQPGRVLRAVTDSSGAFTISDVPVGLTVIRAERKGCASALADAVIEAGERTVRVVSLCAAAVKGASRRSPQPQPSPPPVRRVGPPNRETRR